MRWWNLSSLRTNVSYSNLVWYQNFKFRRPRSIVQSGDSSTVLNKNPGKLQNCTKKTIKIKFSEKINFLKLQKAPLRDSNECPQNETPAPLPALLLPLKLAEKPWLVLDPSLELPLSRHETRPRIKKWMISWSGRISTSSNNSKIRLYWRII